MQIDKQVYGWYEKVENADIDEMLNFKSMIESNEEYIVNYFIHGETNALAEGSTAKSKNSFRLTKVQEIRIFSSLDSVIINPQHIKILSSP